MHQQHQIDHYHPAVGVLHASEDAVVCEPDPSDRDEARGIAQVRRPLISDAAPQMIELGLGNADVENEQRDRDREHTVAERLGPAGVPAVAHRAAFDAGQRCPVLPSTTKTGPSARGHATPGPDDGR